MSGNLTKSEIAQVLGSLSRGMGGKYKAEDFEAVMTWATEARQNAELLDLIWLGYLDVIVEDEGEIVRFVATPKGLESERRNQLERIGV